MATQYPSPPEVGEMRARGCDAVAIAEAERGMRRWRVAQELCRSIERAFAGVVLGQGVGLFEGQGLDEYLGRFNQYRERDETEAWHRLQTVHLNACHSSLSFFDAEGMRFHLPAFMMAELKGKFNFGMAFCLTSATDPDYKLAQFSALSPAQREVVRRFLKFLAADPEYEFERADIRRALRGYWAQPA